MRRKHFTYEPPTPPGSRGPALNRARLLNVLGLGSLIARDDVEGHWITFIQHLEPLTGNRRVLHDNIFAPILRDKAKALLVVPPFYFATGHKLSPISSKRAASRARTLSAPKHSASETRVPSRLRFELPSE